MLPIYARPPTFLQTYRQAAARITFPAVPRAAFTALAAVRDQAVASTMRRAVVQSADKLLQRGNIWWANHLISQNESIRWHAAVTEDDRKTLTRLAPTLPEEPRHDFIRWLEGGEDQFPLLNSPEKPLVMNCADFIYLSLFLAKVIKKPQIASLYQKEFQRMRSEDPKEKHYYGFDLEKTRSLDDALPGDILIVSYRGTPLHLALLAEDDQIIHNTSSRGWIDEYMDPMNEAVFRLVSEPLADFKAFNRRAYQYPCSIASIDLTDFSSRLSDPDS